jgi:hypothetical protein
LEHQDCICQASENCIGWSIMKMKMKQSNLSTRNACDHGLP